MRQEDPDLRAAEGWLAARSAGDRKRLGQWVTPWWVCQAVTAHLASELPPRPQVADLACGDGRWLVAMARARPDARLLGYDIDPSAIEAARRTLAAAGVQASLVCGDALAEGAVPRCDAIVGNPPFVRPQVLGRERATALWARFATATDKSDLFCCFVERALARAPRAALVLGAHALSLTSFAALRRRVVEAGLDGVLTLPRGTFDATVDTVVVLCGPAARAQAGRLHPEGGLQVDGTVHVGASGWSLQGPPPELPGEPLRAHATVHMGIVCGDYARYVHEGRRHPEDQPTCRGRDVRRWVLDGGDWFVRYDPRDMLARKPYVAPKHAGLFDVPAKIVLAGTTGRRLVAAMDEARRFPLDSCYVVHPRGAADPWALLGLLLSSPVGQWYAARFPAPRVKGVEVAQLPVPRGPWRRIAEAARARDDAGVDAAVAEAFARS